jgi:hypothetical protein
MEMPLLPLKSTNLMPAAAVEFVNSMGLGCWVCAWTEIRSDATTTHAKKNTPNLTLTARHGEQSAFVTARIPRITLLPANLLVETTQK